MLSESPSPRRHLIPRSYPRSDDDGYTANPRHTLTYLFLSRISPRYFCTNARLHDYHPHLMTSSFFLIALHLHLRLGLLCPALWSTSPTPLCHTPVLDNISFSFQLCTFVPLVAHLHYRLAYGAWTNSLLIWDHWYRVLFGLDDAYSIRTLMIVLLPLVFSSSL